MQTPVARPPKQMDWLLGFARRQKVCWCKGQDGHCGSGWLSDIGLNRVQRQWGYSGNIPTNSRGSLFPEMPLCSWLSQALGNITGAPRSTTRNSNSNISYPDQLSLLISSLCIPAAMYLPRLGVTEPLGKAFPSSTRDHKVVHNISSWNPCGKALCRNKTPCHERIHNLALRISLS